MTEYTMVESKDSEKKGTAASLRNVHVKKSAQNQGGSPVVSAKTLKSADVKSVIQLQKAFGNQYVQRSLGTVQRKDEDGSVAPEIERSIDQAKGGGRSLDATVQASMENSFGTDFSGVRVHTGSHAETLNRSLNAKAFTTGRDIFFGEGHYNPGSSAGRELLAHELTHVVQQSDEVRPKLTLGQAGDAYEQEADSVAKDVMRMEDRSVQRQPEEEEETIQRQPEEEEEPLQAKRE